MATLKKETIWIEGYGKFEKVVRVSSQGIFSVEVPKQQVKEGIVEITELRAQTLRELNQQFHTERRKFELLFCEFDLVLLYKITERTDSQDGSGAGFVFNWGVFKKVRLKEKGLGMGYAKHYEFVRGFEGVKEINIAWHGDWKNWKELPHSAKVEGFFQKITGAVISIHQNLNAFLAQDLENIQEFKLLGTNDKGI